MFTVLSITLFLSKLFPTIGFQIITEPRSTEDSPCPGSYKLSVRLVLRVDRISHLASTLLENVETGRRRSGAHLVSTTKLQEAAGDRNAAFTRQKGWKSLKARRSAVP